MRVGTRRRTRSRSSYTAADADTHRNEHEDTGALRHHRQNYQRHHAPRTGGRAGIVVIGVDTAHQSTDESAKTSWII